MSSLAAPELRAALQGWASRNTLWEPLVRHDPGERTYALVHRDESVELYLVCWMEGQDTGFHDHDESAAAIAVLRGAVVEERLSVGSAVAAELGAGDSVSIAREAIHRVRHAGGEPAVTLHAYSPPLQRVGTYEVSAEGTLLRHPRPSETPLEAAA